MHRGNVERTGVQRQDLYALPHRQRPAPAPEWTLRPEVCPLLDPDEQVRREVGAGRTGSRIAACRSCLKRSYQEDGSKIRERPCGRSLSFQDGAQYDRTQPPAPLLKALLQSDWTGKVPVERVVSADAPWPEVIQAHLSPFSAPPESSQPVLGN